MCYDQQQQQKYNSANKYRHLANEHHTVYHNNNFGQQTCSPPNLKW